MKTTTSVDTCLEEIINQISPEILETLTDKQIEAIHRGFGNRIQDNHHSIDWRISIPIPRLRLYLILLAGWEQRSQTRLVNQKSLYPTLTLVNFLFFMGFFTVIFSSIFTLLYFLLPSITIPSLSSHPTSIPWINDEYECQKTRRTWQDNKCWDHQHSKDF